MNRKDDYYREEKSLLENVSQAFPFVTVVMPIRDEGAFIPRSLSAVLKQDYPRDRMEVIVADGMSTDGTREIVLDLQSQHPELRLIDNHGLIVSTGLNAAIAQARGEIIVRVDGHTVIASDYVRQCVSGLLQTEADNVGGKMTTIGSGLFGEAVALATSSPFGVGGARFHYSDQEEWVDTVYLGAWWRHTFQRVGLFDEELVRNQDDEFNYRLRKHSGRILLSPRIKSIYTVRSRPRALWRQYFQYGYWKVRVLQKHPRQMRLRQSVPSLFVTMLFGSLLLALFFPIGRALLVLVVGSYLLANLAASVWTARKRRWRHVLLLPLVFAALHLSYGLGFLVGLIRFWDRWGDTHTHIQTSNSASAGGQ